MPEKKSSAHRSEAGSAQRFGEIRFHEDGLYPIAPLPPLTTAVWCCRWRKWSLQSRGRYLVEAMLKNSQTLPTADQRSTFGFEGIVCGFNPPGIKLRRVSLAMWNTRDTISQLGIYILEVGECPWTCLYIPPSLSVYIISFHTVRFHTLLRKGLHNDCRLPILTRMMQSERKQERSARGWLISQSPH